MIYRGEHKDVALRGIELAGTDRSVPAGGMNELIGLIHRDGSLEPYDLTEQYTRSISTGVRKLLVHKTSSGDNMLMINNFGALRWMPMAEYKSLGTNWRDTGLTGVDEVAIVGNMITSQSLHSVVFINGSYENFDTNLSQPDLPNVQLRVTGDYNFTADEFGENGTGPLVFFTQESDPSDIEFFVDANTDIDVAPRRKIMVSLATKAVGEWAKKGGLTGYFMAVVAYRLLNGEYILATMPQIFGRPSVKYDNDQIFVGGSIYTLAQGDNVLPKQLFKTGFTSSAEEYFQLDLENFNQDDVNFISDNNYATGFNTSDDIMSPPLWGVVDVYQRVRSAHSDINRQTNIIICKANSLEYKISSDISAELKSSIQSVCIFITKQVNFFKVATDTLSDTGHSIVYEQETAGDHIVEDVQNFFFQEKSHSDIVEELKKCDVFYKVKEIPFEEITQSNDWIRVDLKGKLGDSLYAQSILPVSAFSNAKALGGKLYAYNNRIHLFDYSQHPSELTDFRQLLYYEGSGQWDEGLGTLCAWRVIAKCKSASHGEYVLDTGVTSAMQTPLQSLNGLICYPNPDCYEMEIRVQEASEDVPRVWSHVLPMQEWSSLGISVCWPADDFAPSHWTGWENINSAGAMTIADTSALAFPNNNRMKVSETNYPYFPSDQTLTIGKSSIIGLAYLAVPISQDAFGRNPLLAFCDDGIYSIGVDETGKLAYKTITMFAPEACISRKSICPLGGAVLFVSKRGLMICTEKGVDFFCPKAMGSFRHAPYYADFGGTGLHIYYNALHHSALTYANASVVDGVSFENFIMSVDTTANYLSTLNAIILSNKGRDYCYLIDVSSRVVTKLPHKVIMDDGNYPEQVFFDGTKAFTAELHSGVNNTQCIFQTRPIYLGGILRKSFRFLLRGKFCGMVSQKAGIYVLGSLDGEHWKLMGAKEKSLSVAGFHDLGCETYRDSVAYLMVIFVGYLDKSSRIDKMEVDGMYN